MRLELNHAFLLKAGVALSTDDLRLGVSLGLVSPPTAVAVAVEAVDRGITDPTMIELAHTRPDDIASVRDSLRAVDPEDADLFPPDSVRKWTYLELRAAYEMRDRLRDPLGVVEELYANFDYPAEVAEFVRYMPPRPGAAVGDDALVDRWASYLDREAAELTTNIADRGSTRRP